MIVSKPSASLTEHLLPPGIHQKDHLRGSRCNEDTSLCDNKLEMEHLQLAAVSVTPVLMQLSGLSASVCRMSVRPSAQCTHRGHLHCK